MSDLQTALDLLKSKYGEFDNIKLLLGAGEGMSKASIEADILRIADGIVSGEFAPQASFAEDNFAQMKVTL